MAADLNTKHFVKVQVKFHLNGYGGEGSPSSVWTEGRTDSNDDSHKHPKFSLGMLNLTKSNIKMKFVA